MVDVRESFFDDDEKAHEAHIGVLGQGTQHLRGRNLDTSLNTQRVWRRQDRTLESQEMRHSLMLVDVALGRIFVW